MSRGIKIKVIIFVGVLAPILVASRPASAETIFLRCADTTFTVNLDNSTVNNRPATINATSIDWEVIPGSSDVTLTAVMYNHTDRIAGTYSSSITYHSSRNGAVNSASSGTVPCTVSSAPPTKF